MCNIHLRPKIKVKWSQKSFQFIAQNILKALKYKKWYYNEQQFTIVLS